MGDAKMSFDVKVVTKVFVGLLLFCMGVTGFVSTKGTEFTEALFNALDQDWLIYIATGLVTLAGLGIVMTSFLKGFPSYVGLVSSIIAVVFWIAIIVFRDFVEMNVKDAESCIAWIQRLAVDFIIFVAILQSTIFKKSK